ncbi:PRC-barrel domain-containing protein [Variovorax sp. 38R]|uniref:PRC-barrel domain-containing protein n=1 Tax=Variovorax sp. 38R TaxID=2774875 RepID=UPI0017834EBB|nr:PRC-barrel domain-containing protein [Variovorax sp. 38R]QOF76129.1 PRC-barrel domain-containing protein [Variovorax sp. 38R]
MKTTRRTIGPGMALTFMLVLGANGLAGAQVAGATRWAGEVTETDQLIAGWSARQSILGRSVYNASGDRLGKVLDLIVGTDKRVTFLIVDTGRGVPGAAQHLVAVPASQLQVRGARVVLPDAARQTLAIQPAFVHAPITRTQSAIVEQAQQDVDKSRQTIAVLERRLAQGSAQERAPTERKLLALRQGQKAVQEKLDDMDAAGAAQWQSAEAEIGQASARLRSAIRNASN